MSEVNKQLEEFGRWILLLKDRDAALRLARATRVDLVAPERDKYFRLRGIVLADGQDVAADLLAAGLARAYSGGPRQPWCD